MTGGNFFLGNCAINVDCGLNKRYTQSLFVWDVEETEYDDMMLLTTIILLLQNVDTY